jgi:hypothetical protein
MSKVDWIGWFATAVFTTSYFCRTPVTLRRVQGFAALAWAAYGIAIHALPIIVANVIVAAAAVWSSFSGFAQPASRKAE